MTAQTPETLLYKGERLSMCSQPLSRYFSLVGIEPKFDSVWSPLLRAYVGTWTVEDDRLYLVGINANIHGEPVTLELLFPGHPERVFAHWFSGTVRCPRGRLLTYAHMGYASVFEEDLLLSFERGVLVSETVKHNGTAEDDASEDDASEGFGGDAATIFPERVVRLMATDDDEDD